MKGYLVELTGRNLNRDGMIAFIGAYLAAPNDADIELRLACLADDPTGNVLMVTLEHPEITKAIVVMTAAQARSMASVAEDAMNKFPHTPEAQGLPNLIMGLRAGANELDAENARQSSSPS